METTGIKGVMLRLYCILGAGADRECREGLRRGCGPLEAREPFDFTCELMTISVTFRTSASF